MSLDQRWRESALEDERDLAPPLLRAPIPGKRSRVERAYGHLAPDPGKGPLQHRRAVQRLDISDLRAAWEDATMGLTGRQHGDLQVKLRWIGNLRSMASRPPVAWDAVKLQADQLVNDLAAFLAHSDLTSRAERQLIPALAQAIPLQDLVIGAMKPLPEVRAEIEKRLIAGSTMMEGMQVVWIGIPGEGPRVSSRAEFDALIAKGKESEDKVVPNTTISLASDHDEARVRSMYSPLGDTEIAFLKGLERSTARVGLGANARGAPRPLESLKKQIEELLMVWDQFSSRSAFSTSLAAQRDAVRVKLDGAHKMVVAKLAPLQNTLNLLQSLVSNVERDIKATLALPRRHDPEHGDGPETPSPPSALLEPTPDTFMVPEQPEREEPVQHRRGATPGDPEDEPAIAAGGLAGHGSPIPHLAALQSAFGRHDLGGVSAHTGAKAAGANRQMGSVAYAMGESIAFGPDGVDLFTAAHEAAHVIQQRAGAVPDGQVGQAGDRFERHADAVAARVVSGESAEDLLDELAPTGAGEEPA